MDVVTYALLKNAGGGGGGSSSNYTVDYYAHNHIHQTGSILADIKSPVNGTLAYVRNDLGDEYYSSQGTAYTPENCIGYWIINGTIEVTSENYKDVTRSGFDGPYTFDNKNDYLNKYILTPNDYILITNDNIDELVTVDETEVYEFYMEYGEWYTEDNIFPAQPKGFYQYLPNENDLLSWQFVQMKSNLLDINFNSSFDVNQTYTFPVSTTNLETLFNPTILRVTWTNFFLPAANVNFVLHIVDGGMQLSTSCLVNIGNKNYNALTVITRDENTGGYVGNLSFVELGETSPQFDYIQVNSNSGDIIILADRKFSNSTDTINSTNGLINTLNNMFSIEIPAYQSIENLEDINEYLTNLSSDYNQAKIIFYSIFFHTFEYFAISVKGYVDGKVVPISIDAYWDLDESVFQYDIKYLHPNITPLAYTTLMSSTDFEPLRILINDLD